MCMIMMLALWVLTYLAMDIAYVVASNGTYMHYVSKIAGGPPRNTTKVAVSALLAYSLMAIGWAYIVVPTAKRLEKQHGKVMAGAIAGGLYGLVLYGVFNGTVGAMFDGWTYGVMLRDTLWGTLSISAFSAAFMVYG